MRAIQQIRQELELASEERRALREAPAGSDSAELAEHSRALDERIAALWAELRVAKAHIRFGPRESIVSRARSEERFNRDLGKRKAA